MFDLTLISQEAKTIHHIFEMAFYSFITVLLVVGILMEFFQLPIGGVPAFPQLVGRVLIASILLVAYPEISNAVAAIADALSNEIGDLNNYALVLKKAGNAFEDFTWSITSVGRTVLWFLAYFCFFVLQATVLFFDAAVLYAYVILYTFSPLCIAFFVLPQTAGITKALFRSLFEVSSWKVVWAVLGVLLWSSAVHYLDKPQTEINIITLASLLFMLALSLILTPLVVSGLIGKGITGVTSTLSAMSAAALSAGMLGPAKLGALVAAPMKGVAATAKGGYRLSSFAFNKIKSPRKGGAHVSSQSAVQPQAQSPQVVKTSVAVKSTSDRADSSQIRNSEILTAPRSTTRSQSSSRNVSPPQVKPPVATPPHSSAPHKSTHSQAPSKGKRK